MLLAHAREGLNADARAQRVGELDRLERVVARVREDIVRASHDLPLDECGRRGRTAAERGLAAAKRGRAALRAATALRAPSAGRAARRCACESEPKVGRRRATTLGRQPAATARAVARAASLA